MSGSVLGIFPARVLEWIAMPSSSESSQPRDRTPVSCIAGRFFLLLSQQGSPVYHIYTKNIYYVCLEYIQDIFFFS